MTNVIIEILREKRVLLLLLLVLSSVAWVFWNGGPMGGGLKFGIDFSGGLRIPVLLERAADPLEMQGIVETIKTRAATFGLTEVRVRPIGDTQVYVEVPRTNPGLVSEIENLLSRQGVFLAVVDGKAAVTGDDILQSDIARLSAAQVPGSDWGVGFSITPQGQSRFAHAVKGKANYPLRMFVDRPTDAIVVLARADLMHNANASGQLGLAVREEDALKLSRDALLLEDSDIPLYLQEDVLSAVFNVSLTPATERTRAVVSSSASEELKRKLRRAGYNVSEFAPSEMQPHYRGSGSAVGDTVVRWDALGLKNAYTLSPSVTEGVPSFRYQITGNAEGAGRVKALAAERNAREAVAVLKGGALPVQITIGSVKEVPAPLGQEFLRLSAIGAGLAMLMIALMVSLRYRTPKVVLPIMLISLSEVVILVAIIGSFSIDLAAMAGLIAAIGVSVDAQIVVTDEILKKSGEDNAAKLEKAFSIIVTNALVATVAMLPLLLFSGLVEIIGFATSTILGYLLGVLITRPAYGVIVQHVFENRAAD